MKKFIISFSVLAVFILASCDNKNIFGRFHKAGSSSSIEVLLNDANTALEEDNPSKAKEIADKILAKDPLNSEALYISAAAGLKAAGFDLGGIITSVIGGSAGGEDADSLLESFKSMDLDKVAAAINEAVINLGKIAGGDSDGAIPTDDVDVNLNLGILELLDAALDLADFNKDGTIGDDNDIIQIDENYNVTVKGESVDEFDPADLTAAEKVQLKEDIETAKIGLSSAVTHLGTAVDSAGISTGDSTIEDLKKSIEDDLITGALNEILDKL